MNLTELNIHLHTRALSIKKRFLEMYAKANAGHIGSSLSAAEIITFLLFDWMAEEDEIILSKGHAAALMYSALAEKGYLTEEDIATFYKDNTYLAAHPPANKIKKIPFATGSLGHGLSLAAGFGLSRRLKKQDDLIFCVTSDGELNEGSIWEAAMFIAHHKLKNVVWLIDKNNLQGFGTTQEVMDLDPLGDKLTAFGFETLEVDGHDFTALRSIKDNFVNRSRPLAIIANTVKGRYWATNENTIHSHYLPFKEGEFDTIIQQLELYHQNSINQLKKAQL